MNAMRDTAPLAGNTPSGQVSEDQLRQMMMDDRYQNPAKRDPNFIKMVEDGFKKIYG
jgi:hypothetical protein